MLASGLLLALGFVFFKLGAYQLSTSPRWLKLGEPITAALGAGIIEEFFFRGLLLGLLGARQLAILVAMPAGLMFTCVFYVSLYFTFTDTFGHREEPPADTVPPA